MSEKKSKPGKKGYGTPPSSITIDRFTNTGGAMQPPNNLPTTFRVYGTLSGVVAGVTASQITGRLYLNNAVHDMATASDYNSTTGVYYVQFNEANNTYVLKVVYNDTANGDHAAVLFDTDGKVTVNGSATV